MDEDVLDAVEEAEVEEEELVALDGTDVVDDVLDDVKEVELVPILVEL